MNYIPYKLCAFTKFILLGFILPICKMGIRICHTRLLKWSTISENAFHGALPHERDGLVFFFFNFAFLFLFCSCFECSIIYSLSKEIALELLCKTIRTCLGSQAKWKKVKVKSLSCVQSFATPWSVAHQTPPSMGFSRQEYWSGLPFPSPGESSRPRDRTMSPALRADALTSEPPGKPRKTLEASKEGHFRERRNSSSSHWSRVYLPE